MHLNRIAARKAADPKRLASAYSDHERKRIAPRDWRDLPLLSGSVEGKRSKVVVKIRGLKGFADDEAKAQYYYWLEMSIPELSAIVSAVMKAAPCAELLRAAVDGAVAAMPRRGRGVKV